MHCTCQPCNVASRLQYLSGTDIAISCRCHKPAAAIACRCCCPLCAGDEPSERSAMVPCHVLLPLPHTSPPYCCPYRLPAAAPPFVHGMSPRSAAPWWHVPYCCRCPTRRPHTAADTARCCSPLCAGEEPSERSVMVPCHVLPPLPHTSPSYC